MEKSCGVAVPKLDAFRQRENALQHDPYKNAQAETLPRGSKPRIRSL